MNKDVKVFATFKENGEYLLNRGVYSVAKIDFDGNTKSHSKTLKEPEDSNATRSQFFGYEFVEYALNLDKDGKSRKPIAPKENFRRWLKSPEGKLFLEWNKASNREKIKVKLDELASDMNCTLTSFDILT